MSEESSEAVVDDVLTVAEAFVDELWTRLDAQAFEEVLVGKKADLVSDDLGQKPEVFAEDELIFPLLRAVGLKWKRQIYESDGDGDDDVRTSVSWPDLGIVNVEEATLGEAKPINNVPDAEDDVVEYLDRISVREDYGIATDGIEWRILKRDLSGDVGRVRHVETIDLRPLLLATARSLGYFGSDYLDGVDLDLGEVDLAAEAELFTEVFERESFDRFLTVEAPQVLRDTRKRDVDEFYELYIELLFGKSEEYDYDSCLMDDIVAPPGGTDTEKREFAVTLVNRLLFIKFLEDKGVIPSETLLGRVEAHEQADAILQSLYESQIKPLFYDLFNTPRDQRPSRFRSGWPSDIPYLNGGLFRENVDQEKDYRVEGETLKRVVRDLIEGSDIGDEEGTIDPAVLGSVFERTINFIGGEFGTQKDIGAYYTPADVTELITAQTVRPKIQQELTDVYGSSYPESVRERIEELELSEMLRRIEEGEGWFGDSTDTEEAYERVGDLSVVDPACGSGHFLTTALEEIQRVRESLLRGLQHDEGIDARDRYESKKEIALESIYGVDIDPVGVEIARLRLWLKIVDRGWEPEYGRLPNIELNIVSGNSLVGLPVEVAGQASVDQFTDRIQELIDLREDYKQDNAVDKEDVLDTLEELREELDDEYLKRLNHTFDDRITDREKFDAVVDGNDGNTLHPEIEVVKVQRADDDPLTDDDKDRLEGLGFRTYKNSGRLEIDSRHEDLRTGGTGTVSHADARETIVNDLRGLIDDHFVFNAVVRQPVKWDLNNILGDPFHWVAEFPEVSKRNGLRRTVDFDIIVGNPPYGDILRESEKGLVDFYRMGDINEVSAQFVERQLEILSDDGFFGNVTTLRLVHQSSIGELHDILRETLDLTRIACFGLRGRTGVFDGVLIRVSIITGQKATDRDGEIHTSDLLVFNDENRQQRFNNIEYNPTEGLVLTDRIGGEDANRAILPKIGPDVKLNLLKKLKRRSGKTFSDLFSKDPDDVGSDEHAVWRVRGGGYWITPMLEELYSAQDVDPMYFETELERKTVFLIMNSSVFFVYWMTYGNQYLLNWIHVNGFPYPDGEVVGENSEEIIAMADAFWERMQDVFVKRKSNRGDFQMSPLRPVINELDEFVGELYGLSDEEVEYVQNYLTDFDDGSARTGSDDARLGDFLTLSQADTGDD